MARIPLTMLAKQLKEREGVKVGYRPLYNKALDGLLPTARQENGRWNVDDDAVPEIAEFVRSLGAAAA